ncbi:MAG TPA: hypothetical protein VH277_09460 [Gemmatimonadaceae bacterium]|nr:hypothetical protein [Gemmatimonadaceae bacterium]
MFDATYFRSQLTTHVQAAGPKPTVEVHLVSGHGHRVRSVLEVTDGYVVLEEHQRHAETTGANVAWEGSAPEPTAGTANTHRAVVSYESITQVVITPSETGGTTRIGFGAGSTTPR